MSELITALPGDGIGPEVTAAAIAVLKDLAEKHDLRLEVQERPVGGRAVDEHGEPLPGFVLEDCRRSGKVLLGAVGDPRFDDHPPEQRPEAALLGLRRELGLYANLRPVVAFPALLSASTLRPETLRGVNILIVRELTGGLYFGTPRGREKRDGARVAFNTLLYHDWEIERIAHTAFQAAGNRRGRVTSVDKSNVLESSQLWRTVVDEVAGQYPDVELRHMLVDNCAMQLVRDPGQFDVLLTGNLFGDILSDEAAMLTGSLGMLPSASLGQTPGGRAAGLYEPVHGSAPDIAGKDRANPLAAILSAALLFRHSLERDDIAREIESAVAAVLNQGHRTADISGGEAVPIGTREMTDRVRKQLKS